MDYANRIAEDWDRYYEALGGGATPEEAAYAAAGMAPPRPDRATRHSGQTATVIARQRAGSRWDNWSDEEREAYAEYVGGMR